MDGNTCIKHGSGFHKAVREMPVGTRNHPGLGMAVLHNLSPQWYNAYRASGLDAAKRRETFMQHVTGTSGPQRWVELEGSPANAFGYEITYFRRPDGRKVLFLCWNSETAGSETGGGSAVGLKTGAVEVTLKFLKPVRRVRNERTGTELQDGTRLKLEWRRNEAVVISFD